MPIPKVQEKSEASHSIHEIILTYVAQACEDPKASQQVSSAAESTRDQADNVLT